MTINDKLVYEKCITMFKAYNWIYPECFLKFSTLREHTGGARQLDDLCVPRTRTDSAPGPAVLPDPVME